MPALRHPPPHCIPTTVSSMESVLNWWLIISSVPVLSLDELPEGRNHLLSAHLLGPAQKPTGPRISRPYRLDDALDVSGHSWKTRMSCLGIILGQGRKQKRLGLRALLTCRVCLFMTYRFTLWHHQDHSAKHGNRLTEGTCKAAAPGKWMWPMACVCTCVRVCMHSGHVCMHTCAPGMHTTLGGYSK